MIHALHRHPAATLVFCCYLPRIITVSSVVRLVTLLHKALTVALSHSREDEGDGEEMKSEEEEEEEEEQKAEGKRGRKSKKKGGRRRGSSKSPSRSRKRKHEPSSSRVLSATNVTLVLNILRVGGLLDCERDVLAMGTLTLT